MLAGKRLGTGEDVVPRWRDSDVETAGKVLIEIGQERLTLGIRYFIPALLLNF